MEFFALFSMMSILRCIFIFMKSILSLILSLLLILPNCGTVFAGNMDQMIKGEVSIEMSEMMNTDMIVSQDESIQNPYYNCCSNAAHNGTLARDTSVTSATKDVVSIAHVATLAFREDFIPERNKSVSIPYRQNAPPDPSEYCSLIGSSVKNLN